ncbi:MAG: TlpA family protein disulfide reductase [Chryseobacterium sp.]|uniref:TlpA family protein disulfide reductase n=1 Tax=Chryseobacterium sp. TaxID=1871047 RepID=UPI000DB85189|nr:TlpA disulfide reductase family protein [Chryseobacterium sp.]MPS65013.1 TlpA family protein disulfide reductase [Chryseobacterium sp.]PZU26656.1 MAG: TlpA family protein disulfide reductase [Chryseobacterium sp.]
MIIQPTINILKKLLLSGILFFCFGFIGAQNSLKLNDTAPEIHLKTFQDIDFKLSSLKGKVVLLDFWATWCAPCVEEQPFLKEIYTENDNAVKEGRFEIVGVSLDKSRDNWKKIIERETINWTQISDLQFWKSPVAKTYGIEELPYNLVLDKSGKVIAINIHGEELKTFIADELKKEFE